MTDDQQHDDLDDELRRLPDRIIRRRCSECGQMAVEFDFYYGDIPPGSGWIGRVYVCRACYGEEAWAALADVPEIGAGMVFEAPDHRLGQLIGRSTRIAQARDPNA